MSDAFADAFNLPRPVPSESLSYSRDVTDDPRTWLKVGCGQCGGTGNVSTVEHGKCGCGLCRGEGYRLVDPRRICVQLGESNSSDPFRKVT